MQARMHLDTVLHLFREHKELMNEIFQEWSKDEEGNLIFVEGPYLDENQHKIIVDAFVGAEADSIRHHPYGGAKSVTSRPSNRVPDSTEVLEDKRIPPAYTKKNPDLRVMATPLDVPGGPPPLITRSNRKGAFDAKQVKGKRQSALEGPDLFEEETKSSD